MNVLVGNTGFVGSNLWASGGMDLGFHSSNIQEAYGLEPDLLIYAGLRAEKYLANHAPEKDMEQILEAEENIRRIHPKQLVLISTVDVYQVPVNVDEDSVIETEGLQPYGYNRYVLEQWVRGQYPDALIVRLPGLFGKNIKKNFIYDMIHVIPFMLKEDKMEELSAKEPSLLSYYTRQDNGFFRCNVLSKQERTTLKHMFRQLGFTALNFTDSRNVYQFYPLSRLWSDLQKALNQKIRLLNIATAPVSAAELYEYLNGDTFINPISANPVRYDFKTKQDTVFGGADGYLMAKEEVMSAIGTFVREAVREEE